MKIEKRKMHSSIRRHRLAAEISEALSYLVPRTHPDCIFLELGQTLVLVLGSVARWSEFLKT